MLHGEPDSVVLNGGTLATDESGVVTVGNDATVVWGDVVASLRELSMSGNRLFGSCTRPSGSENLSVRMSPFGRDLQPDTHA